MTEPKAPNQSPIVAALSFDQSGGAVYVNGREVLTHSTAPSEKAKRALKAITLPSQSKLRGPALKIARAKRHFQEIESTLLAFWDTNPYELVAETDANTGEHILCIRVHKPVPDDISIIAGELVHNLRSALDQTVCGLVRANRKQVTNGNGFPISGSAKKFEEACVGKLKNITPKANRFIRRLKPYERGNTALWMISELDNMDKHNDLVPVAAGKAQASMQIGMPGMFLTPNGGFGIGSPTPGSVPFGWQQGWITPDTAKTVELVNDYCEVYRASPDIAHFQNNIQVTIEITLGKTRVSTNEPLIETMDGLIKLTERILYIVETRIL